MPHLLIQHRVADFATWKSHYDNHASARANAGLTDISVMQSLDDPNLVVALHSFDDLAKVQAFGSSPDLKAAMQAAGVVGEPSVHFLT